MANVGKTASALVQRGLPIGVELVVNFLLPLLIYDQTVARLGEVGALLASSGPPIVWSLIEFARHRRIDAISALVLTGIVLSLLMYLGGGSARLLQLREKLVTVVIGLVFVISALIGRPLIYELSVASMKRDPRQHENLKALQARADDQRLKAVMRTMSFVWGFGLIAEAGLAAFLVMKLSVHDYLLYGPPVGYGCMGLLVLWSFLYVRRAQARGRARRAAEEAAARQAGTSPEGLA